MIIYCMFKIFTSLYGIEPSSSDAVPAFAFLSGLETFFEIVFIMLALILNLGGDICYWISKKLRGGKNQ